MTIYKNPTISIVIPAKGECVFLSETLVSINESNLQPLEIVIIDDGISKNTIDLIYNFKDWEIVRLFKNPNKGLVSALNAGIKYSKGDFIARLDSDDLILSHRLELQRDYLKTNKDVAVVGGNCIYINEMSVEIGRSNYPVGELNYLDDFYYRCLIAHPTVMFRRDDVISLGGYRQIFTWNNVDIAEDFDLWLRFARTGKVVNLSDELIKYRQHSNQLSILNTYGQIIGSKYISAVNLGTKTNYPKIEINGLKIKKSGALIFTIFKNLGLLSLIDTIIKIIYAYVRTLKKIFKFF